MLPIGPNPNETTLENLEGIKQPHVGLPPLPQNWIPARTRRWDETAEPGDLQAYSLTTKQVYRWLSGQWAPMPGGYTFENVFAATAPNGQAAQAIAVTSAPTPAAAKKLAKAVTRATGRECEVVEAPMPMPYHRSHPELLLAVQGVQGTLTVGMEIQQIWAWGESQWAAQLKERLG